MSAHLAIDLGLAGYDRDVGSASLVIVGRDAGIGSPWYMGIPTAAFGRAYKFADMISAGSRSSSKRRPWYAYVLLCRDKTYYIGATNDLDARVDTHNAGQGAKYTRGRTPVKLVYHEGFKTKRQALRREVELKKMTRAAKTALISRQKTR